MNLKKSHIVGYMLLLFLVATVVTGILGSCNNETKELKDGAYFLFSYSDGYYDADKISLPLEIVNKNTSYENATIEINTKGLLSVEGLEEQNGVYKKLIAISMPKNFQRV